MLEFTLGTIFGFVAGCSLKDFIMSKLNSYCKSGKVCKSPTSIGNQCSTLNNGVSNKTMKEEFNLCSIHSIFEKYDVDLISANSFPILLNTIERATYKMTLKQFSTAIQTADDLFSLIENGETYHETIKIEETNSSIMLSEEHLNQIFSQNSIAIPVEKTIEDRIQFIISFYVSRGLSRFKKTMGSSLEHFLTGYKEHKDVSVLFEGIMKIINEALDFLS